MPPRIPERQLLRARIMRRGQTLAEEMLWLGLRNRRLGAKFRRQVPIGAFIADFACVEVKLVVEVDGPSHETDAGRFMDARRDRWFRENGWCVVRVPNALVVVGGDLALDLIKAALGRKGVLLLPLAGEGGPCVSKGRMRALGGGFHDAGLLHRPHPTSLREATFSHVWEKGRRRHRRVLPQPHSVSPSTG
ncbi:endonuclease domain-containing protein [Beijerinckia sp. L45]|uniref:endonuclease domain-containing protein n=1 Tax=Beijerinckia sp. L45 TaxID=1641855 RepID=UPI00131C0E61|nr:DUF559 domain-containing protein [Beijerinckia sp. L45]